MMENFKNYFILAILAFVYLLFGIRYFPDQPVKTLYHTALNLLTIAPLIIGCLLVINSVVKKVVGERLSAIRAVRIYLALGITFEFFIGIYNYLKINS